MTGGASSGRRNRRSRLRSILRGGVEGMRRRWWLLREVVGLLDFGKGLGMGDSYLFDGPPQALLL
jgi:hypothetical protein